jgi:hypothetical protein
MSKEIIPIERIVRLVFVFREQKVMLDSDLASLYGVSTGHLNRAVKRNAGRFPCDFMFQLNAEEVHSLKCQLGTSKPGGGGRRRSMPFVFTEQERRVGKHEEIAAIPEAIRQLMALQEEPRREIGFHVREKAPRYRARQSA